MKRLEKVRESMKRIDDPLAALEGFFAFAPVGFQLFSAGGHPLFENEAFHALFGSFPPPEYNILRDNVLEKQGVLPLIKRAFAGEIVQLPVLWYDPRELVQVTVPVEQGRRSATRATLFPVFDRNNVLKYVAGVYDDVTAEMEAREDQRRSEKKYLSLFQSDALAVCSASANGIIYDANRAFLDLVGYDQSDLIAGRVRWDTMTPPEFNALDLAAIQELKDHGSCHPYQKEFLTKNGTRVPVMVSGAMVDGDLDEIVAVIHNLTRYKQLEEQFRQAQKMEAVGRLAAGIAHDFNNILGLILLHCESALDSSQGAVRDELEALRDAAARGCKLTRQLLAFGRKQVGEVRALTLDSSVSEVERMLKRLIGEDVVLEFSYAGVNPTILADPTQIEQILLNLIVNARDAVPAGGKIRVETRAVELTDGEIACAGLSVAPGPYGLLTVSDDGSGMTEAVASRVFEPFFTTKPQGKGTGLGLSTVFGIVKQHNGAIKMTTAPDKGTRFDVYFPVSNETAARIARLSSKSAIPPLETKSAGGTVLLAEDDHELRGALSSLLRKNGYSVIEAANGAEAVALYRRNVGKIDLIISDIIMPEMTGPKMFHVLAGDRARPHILYMSGYSADELSEYAADEANSFFIEKPFSRASFLEKVSEAMVRLT